jgi:hypothetical protein
MGITNVHCLKDISNSHIYYRFKRGKQKDCYKVSNPKSPKNKYTKCDGFNYNFFGHKHGILQNHIIPDYKVSRTINLWYRHIHVHHTRNEKYIQKVEELYFKTTTKSPKELVFGRDNQLTKMAVDQFSLLIR